MKTPKPRFRPLAPFDPPQGRPSTLLRAGIPFALLILLLYAGCEPGAPSISFSSIEPNDGSGNAFYLPLAAASAGETPENKIVLRLRIRNDDSDTLRVNRVKFSFPGTQLAEVDMQGVDVVMSNSGKIGPGMASSWSNGNVTLADDSKVRNAVYLPAPAPAQVKVSVWCAGYQDPVDTVMSLVPFQEPTPKGALQFPIAAYDLRSGEYPVTSAYHWANGGAGGTQIFAHDINIQAKDRSGSWSTSLPGGDANKNDGFRCWGVALRAMADGEVIAWLDTMPSNDTLGKFPVPTPNPVSGNFIRLRHGNVTMIYCHLQPGTIPASLQSVGAKVKAGQFLGKMGNSGNSSGPHTHIECRAESNGTLRGIPLKNAWVVKRELATDPAASAPWVKLKAQGIPNTSSAIWPTSTYPGSLIPTAGIAAGGDWANSFWISGSLEDFQKTAQDLFDEKGRRLIYVNTYVENGQRKFAGIARSGDWASSFWLSSSKAAFDQKAQDLFDTKGHRLFFVSTFVDKGNRKWIGIARSGDWGNSYWTSNSLAEFKRTAQNLFDTKGRRLIHVETYLENGRRKWVGISRDGDWANSFWISPSFGEFRQESQKLFDEKGRRLVHVSTYLENGNRYWIGIARSGNWANSFWQSGDLMTFQNEAQHLFDEKGRRLVCVELLTDESGN